jgi:osmotically-inducible protein OsmY
MNVLKILMTTGVMGIALAGAACSDKTKAESKDVAQQTASTTKAIATDISDKTAAAASSTGAEVTDTWITAKVKTKFSDESVLAGNKMSVETNNHVVSLRGTVLTSAAKKRAMAIARGTDGVTGVVDLLVVE